MHGDARTGTTSLVTLALLTAGEPPDFIHRPEGSGLPSRIRARTAQQYLCDRAADHGLCGCRPAARLAPHCRQRELAGVGPDQGGRSRPLAGLMDLFQHQGPAWRQLEHPVCPARSERGREAGVPVKPEVWALARPTGSEVDQKHRRKLGLHARYGNADGQHDLRGNLQPDHHRPEAVPGQPSTFRAT